MSSGPTGTGGDYNPKNHLNVKISKKDFCRFHEECQIDNNLDRNLCLFCKWRTELDIRLILDIANCERNNEC